MSKRYTYIGDCAVPAPGSSGEAFPASGCDDPESGEEGAWLFHPDGDENAYYVDPVRDLQPAPDNQTGNIK